MNKAPERYRRRKELEEYFKVKTVGEWTSGGFAPWQAYLPVQFKGVNYTIYIRERHGLTTASVMWGHEGKGPRKYYGFLGRVNLLEEEDLNKDLYKIAEKRGKEYIKELEPLLPNRER